MDMNYTYLKRQIKKYGQANFPYRAFVLSCELPPLLQTGLLPYMLHCSHTCRVVDFEHALNAMKSIKITH